MVKKAIVKKGAKVLGRIQKPKPKTRVTKPKPSPAAKAKTPPKSKIPAAVAPIAAGTAVVGAGIAGAKGQNKRNQGGKTFDDAFRTARAKGEGTKFTFNGKSYVAVTKDDLKKKGYSTLAEYNRAGGKKKIDVDAAAKKIAGEVNKNKKPKTIKGKGS
jgi:hypothetical protein